MKLAIVHDGRTTFGGAERVLRELLAVFPEAPVYVLERSAGLAPLVPPSQTSFLQYIPAWIRKRRLHLPLAPVAPETFDLSAYDVVLSATSSFAKGLVTRPGTLHLCYCHAATRFLWDAYHDLLREQPAGTLRRGLFACVMHGLRLWDHAAAGRVDLFIANSEATRARIRKYYGCEAMVIPPPNVLRGRAEHGARDPRRTFFLFVGRLSPYKGVTLALDTFLKLGLPLRIIGQGRLARSLRRRIRPPLTSSSAVSDEELSRLYAEARAVIFPSDDDFGLVPVEAMSFGTPVLALRRGGAVETVQEGITGEFFDEPTEEFLADCVRRFLEREGTYDRERIRSTAERFAVERFRFAIQTTVEQAWKFWQHGRVQGATLRQALLASRFHPTTAFRETDGKEERGEGG